MKRHVCFRRCTHSLALTQISTSTCCKKLMVISTHRDTWGLKCRLNFSPYVVQCQPANNFGVTLATTLYSGLLLVNWGKENCALEFSKDASWKVPLIPSEWKKQWNSNLSQQLVSTCAGNALLLLSNLPALLKVLPFCYATGSTPPRQHREAERDSVTVEVLFMRWIKCR